MGDRYGATEKRRRDERRRREAILRRNCVKKEACDGDGSNGKKECTEAFEAGELRTAWIEASMRPHLPT